MFKRLKKKFTKYITRIELRDIIWFDCAEAKVIDCDIKRYRRYLEFPDGMRIIIEGGKYVGFYTQEPPV